MNLLSGYGDLASSQRNGLLWGVAAGTLVNYLSEQYLEQASSSLYTSVIGGLASNSDFAGTSTVDAVVNDWGLYASMTSWDTIQAIMPWAVNFFRPGTISTSFAWGWTLQYILTPWATVRWGTVLQGLGLPDAH